MIKFNQQHAIHSRKKKYLVSSILIQYYTAGHKRSEKDVA